MRNGGDADLKRIAEMIAADQGRELGGIQQLLASGSRRVAGPEASAPTTASAGGPADSGRGHPVPVG